MRFIQIYIYGYTKTLWPSSPTFVKWFFLSNVHFSLSLPDRIIIFFEIWSRNSLKTLSSFRSLYNIYFVYNYFFWLFIPLLEHMNMSRTWPKICARLSYILFIAISNMRGKIFKRIQYCFFEKNKSSPSNPSMSWHGFFNVPTWPEEKNRSTNSAKLP